MAHSFAEAQLYSPTWCDACRGFIRGLVKQALKCERCDMIVHKQCRVRLADTALDRCRCSAPTVTPAEQFETTRCDLGRTRTLLEVDRTGGALFVSTPGINRANRRRLKLTNTTAEVTPGRATVEVRYKHSPTVYTFASAAEAARFVELIRAAKAACPPDPPHPRLGGGSGSFGSTFVPTRQAASDAEAQRMLQCLEECRRRGLLSDAQLKERQSVIANVHRPLPPPARPEEVTTVPAASAQPAPPPEAFALTAPVERATKATFDLAAMTWREETVSIQLSPDAFSQGSLRVAYKMLDLSRPAGARACAAKVAKPGFVKEGETPEHGYKADVVMQAHCKAAAEAFNAHNPPKRVQFLDTFLIRRAGEPSLLAAEPFLPGDYVRHSNNNGYVSYDARNTPQAFSHFSYEYFNRCMIIVDIQGVNDVYTDPQIHSVSQQGFGLGNCGTEGIEKFFESHRCNSICHFLGLTQAPAIAGGTVANPLRAPPGAMGFRLGQHVRVRPVRGSSSPNDRAFLDITESEFDSMCDAFNMYDEDGSGEIELRELLPLLEGLGFQLTGQRLEDILTHIDQDGSGAISFMEFLCWWKGIEL